MAKESPDSTEDANGTPENLTRSGDSPGSEPDTIDTGVQKNDESDIEPYSEPDATPEKELDQDALRDLLTKKGTIEILAQLADGPKRFSEVDNALTVSHGTVATRLTEGIKRNLWHEYITYPDEGGKVKLYELKPEAEDLARIAIDENIDKTTEQKRKAYEEHDAALSNVRDRITSDT